MKHSYLSLENLIGHIIAIKNTGTAVIVRVPQDDFTYAKKVLEMGVDGSIFPMVKTAEQAKKLIDYTLYPPYGNRGFGPMNAVDFGFADALKYWWDKGIDMLSAGADFGMLQQAALDNRKNLEIARDQATKK